MADFFGVSLDYVVYGEPVSAPRDNSSLARYVEHALTDVQTRASRHSDLMTRIGRVLADRIDSVARDLAESGTAGLEGLVERDEVLRLERYCQQADIVATDLGPNIIDMPGGDAAAGQFLQVVAANITKGCRYRFLLAGDLSTRPEAVTHFRSLVAAVVGGDQLNENCAFRRTVIPVIGGAGLYRLDVATLAMEEPALLTQFSKYLLNGTSLGYLNAPNDESSTDMLMSPSHLERAFRTFDALWYAAGTRI